MWLTHEAWRYWQWAGSNVGAMPLCGVVAAAFGYLLRDRIGTRLARWLDSHHGPHAVKRHLEALTTHNTQAGRNDDE